MIQICWLVASRNPLSRYGVWKATNFENQRQRMVSQTTGPYQRIDLTFLKDKEHPDYVRLIGHAGPVYGTSFNHDNEYLISCSQDQTARLWNMHTFENVVVYKSHNYPVWDVDFGPFGFYFATASHDRTARLWTCDHTYPLRIFAGHLSDVDVRDLEDIKEGAHLFLSL